MDVHTALLEVRAQTLLSLCCCAAPILAWALFPQAPWPSQLLANPDGRHVSTLVDAAVAAEVALGGSRAPVVGGVITSHMCVCRPMPNMPNMYSSHTAVISGVGRMR